MNKRPTRVIDRFKRLELGDVGISTITLAELNYGVEKSTKKELNQQRLNEFITPLQILNYDDLAAKEYGDIRNGLEKSGSPIGPLDTLIAAHARSRDWILVSNNEAEFRRIENLKVENWA
jgi:tRNA(fMet)-specific endonuclease VapC